MQFARYASLVVVSVDDDEYFIPRETVVRVQLKQMQITIAFDKYKLIIRGDETLFGEIKSIIINAHWYPLGKIRR